jgi:hypothetical protein
VKINFFKDKILKETKYIKYPIYTKILIQLKNLTNLKLNISDWAKTKVEYFIIGNTKNN